MDGQLQYFVLVACNGRTELDFDLIRSIMTTAGSCLKNKKVQKRIRDKIYTLYQTEANMQLHYELDLILWELDKWIADCNSANAADEDVPDR